MVTLFPTLITAKGPEMSASRAERRNAFHADRRTVAPKHRKGFRWKGAAAKVIAAPAVTPNKRDRSPEADARRAARSVTMDFTDGAEGISRALINHALQTISQKKPKRGWAAKQRRAPFPKDNPLHIAKHSHPRHKRVFAIAQAKGR